MRRDLRPAGFLPARGNRSSAWAHTRNQPRACETGQRNKHGARLARRRRAAGRLTGPSGRKPPADKGNARKAKGAELSFSGVSVRWGTFGPTFYIFMEVWRGLLSGRFPSGHREQGLGFFPARENRSPARATHLESTACVRGWAHTQTRCAICPPQARVRARRRERKDKVRELPGAAARACETRGRKRQGARLAHRRCAGKKQTGRTALQAADALQAATRVTSLPAQTALRRDGACANCPPQARRCVRRRLRRRARRLSGRKSPPRCAPE